MPKHPDLTAKRRALQNRASSSRRNPRPPPRPQTSYRRRNPRPFAGAKRRPSQRDPRTWRPPSVALATKQSALPGKNMVLATKSPALAAMSILASRRNPRPWAVGHRRCGASLGPPTPRKHRPSDETLQPSAPKIVLANETPRPHSGRSIVLATKPSALPAANHGPILATKPSALPRRQTSSRRIFTRFEPGSVPPISLLSSTRTSIRNPHRAPDILIGERGSPTGGPPFRYERRCAHHRIRFRGARFHLRNGSRQ